MTDLAVDCALDGESGVIGQDEDKGDELRAIEFSRIKGGKPFDFASLGSPTCWPASASRPPRRHLTTELSGAGGDPAGRPRRR